MSNVDPNAHKTPLFEFVENDFYCNFLMDNLQQNPYDRINSNQNFQHHQYDHYDDYSQENQIKQEEEEPIIKPMKQKTKKNQSKISGGRLDLIQSNTDVPVKQNNSNLNNAGKTNPKNTYINKITCLMSGDPVIKNPPQKGKVYSDEKLNERKNSEQLEDGALAKQMRNRECARNSRKRKKIYIELLENKVKTLTEELEKYKRILKTSTASFGKMGTNSQLQGFFLGKQQLYEKLENAIQNSADNNQLNLLLDSMRFRVGGGGKERVNASNYFFSQILELCFPIHVRYLLWSASQNSDFFADHTQTKLDSEFPEWNQEVMNVINLTEDQRKKIIKQQQRLLNDKSKLEEILTQFQNIKEQLYNKTSSIENFIDDLRKILTPTQVAKFLIGLDKNKYRREMNVNNIWSMLEEQASEIDLKDEEEEDYFLDEEQQFKKVHI